MTVTILQNAPQRLRGVFSRYCLEVRAGVFVGRLDGKVRELLWSKVIELAGARTKGVMVWRTNNAQGYAFSTHGDDRRQPIIVDGLWLIGELPDDGTPTLDTLSPT